MRVDAGNANTLAMLALTAVGAVVVHTVQAAAPVASTVCAAPSAQRVTQTRTAPPRIVYRAAPTPAPVALRFTYAHAENVGGILTVVIEVAAPFGAVLSYGDGYSQAVDHSGLFIHSYTVVPVGTVRVVTLRDASSSTTYRAVMP